MTIHPTVLYHMIVSPHQLHARLLLPMEAERQRSPAAESGSAADAGGSQVQRVVRWGCEWGRAKSAFHALLKDHVVAWCHRLQ